MDSRAAQPRFVAIIPARGGSKGLPRKNVLPLAGLPLIMHSIQAAQACAWVSAVVVSTDDAEIAGVAQHAGAQVIMRPAELATDGASTVDVVLHALAALAEMGQAATHFVLLQPTSPLRTHAHISACLAQLVSSRAACGVSLCAEAHHPQKALVHVGGQWLPVSGNWSDLHQARQALPLAARPNGAIYAMASAEFLARRCFVFEPMAAYMMDAVSSIDIDSAVDLAAAQAALAAQASTPTRHANI